jgi:two-component system, OmpR family, response regulator
MITLTGSQQAVYNGARRKTRMKPRIALVEDDAIILKNYSEFLQSSGFDVNVYESREGALEGFKRIAPEVVLLDVALHHDHEAGFSICNELRRMDEQLPIIFLTSRTSLADRISGMRLGADDYITKDVSMDYLVVRIQALLRRRAVYRNHRADRVTPATSPDGIAIDNELLLVTWRAKPVDLSLTEFWILRELCKQPGQLRTHDDLMVAARTVVARNTITAHIKAIRDAFRRADPSFDCIISERGRGYRWVPR